MEKKIAELETRMARLEKIVLCLADLVPDEVAAKLVMELCVEHIRDTDPVAYETFLKDYKNEET